MKRIRIGNDIEILWAIYVINGTKKSPYDLTGKNLSLYLKGPKGRTEVSGHTSDQNILKWIFFGMEQHHPGTYSLELVVNEGSEGMHTIDRCNAFSLVKSSCDIFHNSGSRIECIRPTKHSTTTCNSEIEYILLEFSSTMSVGMPTSGIVVDDTLSLESENPVQNKVVTEAINELSDKVDSLLYPTVFPTFSAPSASISLVGYAPIQEVGADTPKVRNFSTSFDPGLISLNGVKQNDRAGALDADNSFIYIDNNPTHIVATDSVPTALEEGDVKYTYRAFYKEGAQPKDSKGNDYSTPLAAGYVDSPSVKVNGTWPWFASTLTASEENPAVKQALVSWSKTVGAMSTGKFTLQPSGTLPQVFKLPRKLQTLQMFNTISGQMDTISLNDYTETTETINGHTYYVYIYNGSARGSVTLLAQF